jgi:hypothetical protein
MTTATIEVTGRNGSIYDARYIARNLFIVGKFIVRVESGKCEQTICRATKANVQRYSK